VGSLYSLAFSFSYRLVRCVRSPSSLPYGYSLRVVCFRAPHWRVGFFRIEFGTYGQINPTVVLGLMLKNALDGTDGHPTLRARFAA
jgi:hypothetical protein